MLLLAIFLTFAVFVSQAEIKLIQTVFRHGDRAASGRYPTDPNLEDVWPRGYSQLTDIGYSQAIELGQFLRTRYSTLLPINYNRKDILVRSSDKDRCIETAMGVTAGLYPKQRIPVHTYSNYWEDLLLKPNSVLCAKADREERQDKAILHQRLNLENQDFFRFVSKASGMTVDMSNVKDLYNTLYREVSNGLPQPDWVWQSLSNNRTVFEHIVELKRLDRIESFNSFDKSRLRTGFLVHTLVKNIEESISEGPKKTHFTPLLRLYASHDATLTSLMYSLGVSDDQLPPYAAAILLELHEEGEAHFVKLFYRTTASDLPRPLMIPGCSCFTCSLEEFRAFTAPRSIASKEMHDMECGNNAPAVEKKDENMVINTILSSMVLLLGENLQSLSTSQKR